MFRKRYLQYFEMWKERFNSPLKNKNASINVETSILVKNLLDFCQN